MDFYICMIMNVLTVFITFLPGVSNTVLAVQVVTLYIAGFGLQSMAEGVDKKSARSANVTSWSLITIMIITMVLVTVSHLYPQVSMYTTIADNILILVRVIMTVVYGHVVHTLRHASAKKQAAEEKQVAANDQVALSNQQKVQTLDTQVNGLTQQVNGVVNAVNALRDQVNAVNVSASQVNTSVDLEQFTALSQTVYEMKTSVSQVNQNILNITQNLYNTPGQRTVNEPFTRHIDEVHVDQTPLQGIPERVSSDPNTEHVKALPVPYIEVPGVPQEKVQAAILEHLSGTAWGRLPGKYSTNKLIRDAYEIYQSTQGQRVNA